MILDLDIGLKLLTCFGCAGFLNKIVTSLVKKRFATLSVFLPMKVSFFAFRSLDCAVSICQGSVGPLADLLSCTFCISFFPRLMTKPVIHTHSFVPRVQGPLFISRRVFKQKVFLVFSNLFGGTVVSSCVDIGFMRHVFSGPALCSNIRGLVKMCKCTLRVCYSFSKCDSVTVNVTLLLKFRFGLGFGSPCGSTSVARF